MVTRRRFLQLAAWSGGAIAIGALTWRDRVVWAWDRAAPRLDSILRSPGQRLRSHFDYLDLEPAGIGRYFEDYARYRDPLSRHLPLPPDVYTRYLLSTDFFQNGADQSRRVNYVGFYDPYVTPCNNPLAILDDRSGA